MKTMLITGASAGVGLSLARHYSSSFHVLALARRKEQMQKYLKGYSNITIVPADLGNLKKLSLLADRLQKKHGPILHLINNAVVLHRCDVDHMELKDLEASFRINFFAPFVLMRKLLPGMRKANYGRIINVSTGGVFNNTEACTAYSASKAALNSLTITAAKENADKNIKINLMSPGPVRTEMSPSGALRPEVCHPTSDYLVNLGPDGPTGRFFWLGHEIPTAPDVRNVGWHTGKAGKGLRKIL